MQNSLVRPCQAGSLGIIVIITALVAGCAGAGQGAVEGAAGGAVGGAVQGSQRAKAEKDYKAAQEQREIEEFRREILLSSCD